MKSFLDDETQVILKDPMFTLSEIAKHMGARVIGDDTIHIQGVSSFETAQKNHLTFITKPEYLNLLSTSHAAAIIVSSPLQTSKPQLVFQNPKLGFAKALELFDRPKEFKPGIDPRSWIEEHSTLDPSVTVYPFVTIRSRCNIGKNVILYPGVYVGPDVVIGDDCILFPNVTILASTQIGKRVLIHSGSIIGEDGFGYIWDGKQHYKVPQVGKVVIEDDVEIGANACIDRATTGQTHIGMGTKIDNLVQVGHNNQIGKFCILCGQVGLAGSVHIGDGSLLGGQSGVADHLKLLPGSRVAAQSGVLLELNEKEPVMGYPAVNAKQFFRMIAALKKLPDLLKTIRRLEKEVEELKRK
ncbi:MAG: UDP-3-O-(3-hydroxymyristoyl)glucosamine N-acyltransferase [Deltaproteobacteria bacterium]|nr:UDP-3-O-(3-hydroxymyristoyl)glucosamine N-acyltransferase [Deltaproteobacteria bacterium]